MFIDQQATGPKPFDLDELLESVMYELVILPLKNHLDDMIFREFGASVSAVMEHMYYIRDIPLSEMGLKVGIYLLKYTEYVCTSCNY